MSAPVLRLSGGPVVSAANPGDPPPAPTPMAANTVANIPGSADLDLYQGDDLYFTVTVTNPDGSAANLTGATAASTIRPGPDNPTVIAAFTCTISTNVITLHLPNAQSALLTPTAAVWDLQITTSIGEIYTLLFGNVNTVLQVTQP